MSTETGQLQSLLKAASELSRTWPSLPAGEKIAMLSSLIGRIVVSAAAVAIEVCGSDLVNMLLPGLEGTRSDLPVINRVIPAGLKRTGMQNKLLIDAQVGTTMRELAQQAGVGASYFARVVRLAFIAPTITDAILRGSHPDALTANKLQHVNQLANAWTDQQCQLD